MLYKRYPRLSVSILCFTLFTVGYFYERSNERVRVQSLEESAVQADRDFSDLVYAYEQRLRAVHELVTYALKHKVNVPSSLLLVLETLDDKPAIGDASDLATYQTQQAKLGRGARDLIALMDMDLSNSDGSFAVLFQKYLSQESLLSRLESSYAQQARRVRALARKGDRLPASVKM